MDFILCLSFRLDENDLKPSFQITFNYFFILIITFDSIIFEAIPL